jgi:hypothetical protein
MRPALSIFVLMLGPFLTQAGSEELSGARRWLASPDNRHLLTFAGENPNSPDAFTIQDLHGKTLLSSRDCAELRDVNYEPEHVRWSPDGEVISLAAGHAKFLLTYIFVRSGDAFVSVSVPPLASAFDNPWILPVEWLKDRTLRVKISGPHAGKAGNNGYYHGEAKLRITLKPPKCEKIDERIK